MPLIPFGEWLPDVAALGSPGALRAANCFPGPTGYKPAKSLQVTTNALAARARGAISAKDKAGTAYQFAGAASKLYQLVDQTWTDVSKSGGYAAGTEEIWDFVRWKNKIIATDYTDAIQQIEMAAALFSDLTTDFKARRLAVVRDFVVAGNTNDATDGAVPNRVRWSAFNDDTDWTVSAATQSDYQDLHSGGGVQRILGGEYGVVLSDRSVRRMTYVGSPAVFQFDEVLPDFGLLSPSAATRLADIIYFASPHGFVALEGGTRSALIGAGKVDKFFLNDLDYSNLHRISSAVDAASGRVLWAYPGQGSADGLPNRILVYDRGLQKWSLLEIEVDLLWHSLGASTTLEGLDAISASLDALASSLDSPRWAGGAPVLGGFNSAFKSGYFDGSALAAEIGTGEMELAPGRRAILRAARLAVDGGTATISAGTRNKQEDATVFSPAISARDSGVCPMRSTARYHRFRVGISGEWNDAVGLWIEPEDVSAAGRR